MKKHSQKIFFASIGTLLVLGILVALNIILSGYPLRLDFTDNQVYTLSSPTKKLLTTLDDPLIIKAYITSELPAERIELKRYLENILKEFKVYGGNNITVEFINPNTSQELEMAAQQAGILPLQFNTLENDSFSSKRGYLGVSIQYGDTKEVIPAVTDTKGLEYDLTSRIKKITSKNLPVVGVLQGYGAPSLQFTEEGYSMNLLSRDMEKSYSLKPLPLKELTEIPTSISVLLIAGIKESIPQEKISLIKNYLSQGGNLILAQSARNIDITQGINATDIDLQGLESILAEKGIAIEKNLIADSSSKQIPISTRNGMMIMQQLIDFPLIPEIKNIPKNIITQKLSLLSVPFVSSLKITPESSGKTNIILTSSPESHIYNQTGPINPLETKALLTGTGSSFPLALTKEEHINNKKASTFVIGSSGCVTDQLLQASNDRSCLDLLINAVDWTLQDPELIEVRNKGFEKRPLKETSPEEKLAYKSIALGLPSFILILSGLFYWRSRIKRSKKHF